MYSLIKNNIPIMLIVILFLSACSSKQQAENKATASTKDTATAAVSAMQITFTPDQYKLSEIETGSIEKRNLSNIIKLNGVVDVEPESMATVSAPLGGYIKTAGLLPGEAVKKGQVLATLENPEFITIQQEYLESKGRMQFLEKEYQRQQALREEDINAAKTFQKVASEYQVMQARINALEQKLALIGISRSALQDGKISRSANLYSPISGYIKTSNVNIGKYVTPTEVLFEIVNKNDLHLALNAFAKDLPKIRKGQTVKFSLANENNYNRTAEVFLIGQATGEDRIIPVHCHLTQKSDEGLLPGMYVKAWIETGSKEQYALPSEAIVQLEGKDYIILQTAQDSSGYTFRLVPVKKGIEQEDYSAIELPSNVNLQEAKVVTENAYTVLSALKMSEEEE